MADAYEWHGTFAVLDTATEDGRLLESAGITWRDLPIPLRALEVAGPGQGHDGGRTIGRIDNVWVEGDELRGDGILDEGPWEDVDELFGVLDIVSYLENDGIILGGGDFDNLLYEYRDDVMVNTYARLSAFTIYPPGSGTEPAFGDRTWIKPGAWPA